MGYAFYEIYRNGEKIEAGYGVPTVCEQDGCTERIDRGLAHLCGKTPGGDEHGCGGYFCEDDLNCDNQCKPCAEAADKANTWVRPDGGEEFDLRDRFLPVGQPYDGRGIVWKHTGNWQDGVPLVEPVYAHTQEGAPGAARALDEGEWENAAVVMYRQIQETAAT